MAKTFTVEIDEKGNCEINLEGFHGKGCSAIMDGLLSILGDATERKHKPEFNEKPILTLRSGQ